MYRVALNAAIDINRKMTLLPKFTDLPMEDLNISDSENSIPAENADILYNTISHLNAIDKAIILMYLDDFSYEEISDAMGISKSNVGVKINRIKSQIKKKLDCHEKK